VTNESQWIVGPDAAGTRLDKFLARSDRAGSRGRAASALERGKVLINGAEAGPSDAARRLVAGDVVRLWMDRPGSAKTRRRTIQAGALRILYEDETLFVLDKPAGVLAVPLTSRKAAPSIFDLLRDHLRSRGGRRPFVVHRIDLDTSGVVVFAKDVEAQAALKAQFRRREPTRIYQAVVNGHPHPPQGIWRDYVVWDDEALIQQEAHKDDPGAKEAISEYRVIEQFRDTSLIEVRLRTGRRNQIRLQAHLHGHSVIGERQYVSRPEPSRAPAFPRQALHAHRLAFRHPRDGRLLEFEVPLPADLVDLIARLRRSA
jgi:23S rRNA pseudouridine1911/1915/1917 synthase